MPEENHIPGTSYQPKSADSIQIIMTTDADPVVRALDEISIILSDPKVQRWLTEQGSVPRTLILPWLQTLYGRGTADGFRKATSNE